MLGAVRKKGSDPEALAAMAARGDDDAFAQLLLRMMPLISSKISRLAPQLHGDHEDLVQEGAIGLMNAVSHYRLESGTPFAAYASVCIENGIVSALRARNRKKNLALNESLPLDELELSSTEPSADPDSVVLGRERLQHIIEAVQTRLSSRERMVLDLYLGDYSYKEIADRLGLTGKSVDNAMQRIRQKLNRFVSAE